ncbi:LOW QUALITY PROTEIN: hypothetical protein Cgig2_029422 [Carnegiea gigantea]|uniref:Uncharacterized protein n=1 Tax=Carnegiea gigantea TaxID=171969 RepID=A0A9Q1JNA8_9CARY|nr:LOW QUALITY PROTEIN: hypothetical protein Cgig2_029422 [Carnegiea gigantea]
MQNNRNARPARAHSVRFGQRWTPSRAHFDKTRERTYEGKREKKALYELADNGQIDRFLKKGLRFLQLEQEPAQPQLRHEECSTEVVATIAGGYAEGITRSAWKPQLRSAQEGPCVTAPTMVFGGKEAPRCASPHNDPLVVEMKNYLKKLGTPNMTSSPWCTLSWASEVNPIGMIRLPVRFDNKLRSKNLEVDFLVVDVPTAYSVILGHPTLHGVASQIRPGTYRLEAINGTSIPRAWHSIQPQKKKKEEGGLCIGLSTVLVPLQLRSPGLSIQGVGGFVPCILTLGGRRDKLHLLRVTALIGGLLTLIHVVEVGLKMAILLKLLGQRLCVNTRGYRRGLADSHAPWPGPPQLQPSPMPPLAGAATLSFQLPGRLDQPLAFPSTAMTSPSTLRYSAVTLTPQVNTSAVAISSSVTLGRSEAPGVTKSRDLTKSWTSESLAVGSALMKLVDGRWVIGEEPPAAWEATPMGCDPQMTGYPIDEGLTVQFSLSPLAMGWRPRPRPDDPPSVDVSGLWNPGITRKGAKQGYTLYLLGLLGDEALPLLFLPTLSVGRHLLRGGVPGLENRQPCPRLICIKQKESQPIQRLPLTRLALPPLGALHGLNCLSHKLRDGPRPVVLTYVKLEVTGRLSLLSCRLPKWSGTSPQPDSRCTKRKSYFQCFTFDFFSMAVMQPDLLLKQYHLRSPVSLGALWTVCTRLNAYALQLRPRSS